MTINISTPDSTFFSTGSLPGVGGGTTVHGATSDGNTTTGVTASADNKYAILGLTNPTGILGNQRIRAYRIRATVARTAADLGHNQRAQGRLRDIDNQLGPIDEWVYSSTAFKEFIGPWRTSAPGGRALNGRQNSMRLDVAWPTRINGAVQWLEVRELAVDWDYNDRPTVSAVDLTNFATSQFPGVIWTYADTEQDPQVKYRIKVFLTSDTVLGGFDPETSRPAYDSGDRNGDAQDFTITGSLTNGSAYTPYVKSAQRWDGPEGPLWWSTWVAGTSRTISTTPPATPTVVTTPMANLPEYRVLHTITAGSPGGGTSNTIEVQRLEKLSRMRGPFYNWAHPQIQSCGGVTIGVDGFYTRLSAFLSTFPLDTASPQGPNQIGGRMISWTPTVGPFSGLDIGLDTNVTTDEQPPYLWPVVPGLPMRLSVWARTRSGTFVTKLHHITVTANNTPVTDTVGSSVTLNTSWQRLEVTFTPTSTAVYGRASIENVTPTTGVETLWHGWQPGPDPGANAQLQGGIGRYLALAPDTSWETLRTFEVMSGIPSGGKVYVVENEVIPGRAITYRVRSTGSAVGTITSPWGYYTTYMAPPARTLLRDPFQKENVLLLKRDGRSTETFTEDLTTFHATGRDGDPIVMSDWRSGQDGSMEIFWETALELKQVRDLVQSNRPVLVQWFDGGGSYLRFTNRSYNRWDSSAGQFSGDYLEQERP